MSYRKVDTRLWDDERVAPLSALAKLTWLCLLTGPHTTGLPGLYSCGLATLSESMREGIDTVSKAVADLVATGMIQFNPTVRVVRVPNAPRYNPCANEKVLKGWFALWKSIPDCAEKFSHIERLRDSLDPSSPWVEKGWAGTFGTVSVPERYRIQTVSISTATATTAATDSIPSPAPSAATPLPSQSTSPSSVATPPLTLDLGDPTPPKAKPAPRKASTPKPAKPPPPFAIGDAFAALASASQGRFAPGIDRDWTQAIRIAVANRIRQYPDLAEWRLVGSWLLAGGDGYRTSLGPSWAASNALPDAMARAREWEAKGGDVIAARFTPAAPDPAADVWASAARKAGVAL